MGRRIKITVGGEVNMCQAWELQIIHMGSQKKKKKKFKD